MLVALRGNETERLDFTYAPLLALTLVVPIHEERDNRHNSRDNGYHINQGGQLHHPLTYRQVNSANLLGSPACKYIRYIHWNLVTT